jgi:adenylate kinase
LLLGAPGAGKGTQAIRLSQRLGLPHVSSGDIFRENSKNRTELGQTAEGFIARGQLVPDDVTIAMIRERLSRPDCAAGAILDGFPRTPAQAQAMDGMLAEQGGKVDAVFYIRVRPEGLAERLAGRWICRAGSHIYHMESQPPQRPGVCDVDGSELYQRPDDHAGTVAQRTRVYLEQTAPLIRHYRDQGVLFEIDGDRPIDVVTQSIFAALPQAAES